ncbi:MAG: efflux RND transporter periplasmic adaptor subunit, partial [Gammaproteobacteria bacterium]|nr:efflux RND transporter periplasmic adaptor subunit [Gammaproteobacteria bacterium]
MTKSWGVLVGTMLLGTVNAAEIEPIAAESQLEIAQVKRQSVSLTSTIGGSVTALKTVSLAAQLPGRVRYIAGNEGDRFSAGALLLGLDNTALRAQLQAAQADYSSAQAAIQDAKAKLNREINSPSVVAKTPGGMAMPSMMDQMFMDPMQSAMGTRDTGAERHSDLVARQVALSQAKSNLLRSQAQIQQIEASLRDSQSVAPFAGVIIKRHVELGDTVQPGQTLLAFADTSRLEVKIDVPVRLRSALKIGMTLDVRLDDVANGRPVVQAVISRIFPVADSVRHTVPLELLLPEK